MKEMQTENSKHTILTVYLLLTSNGDVVVEQHLVYTTSISRKHLTTMLHMMLFCQYILFCLRKIYSTSYFPNSSYSEISVYTKKKVWRFLWVLLIKVCLIAMGSTAIMGYWSQQILISTHEFDAIWQLSNSSSMFTAQHFSINIHTYVVARIMLYKAAIGTCWF